jgi:hypothetical protein
MRESALLAEYSGFLFPKHNGIRLDFKMIASALHVIPQEESEEGSKLRHQRAR